MKRVDEFSFLIILNAKWIELKYFWTLDLCLNVEFDIPTFKSGPWEELVWGRGACFRGKFPPKPPVGMPLWGYLRTIAAIEGKHCHPLLHSGTFPSGRLRQRGCLHELHKHLHHISGTRLPWLHQVAVLKAKKRNGGHFWLVDLWSGNSLMLMHCTNRIGKFLWCVYPEPYATAESGCTCCPASPGGWCVGHFGGQGGQSWDVLSHAPAQRDVSQKHRRKLQTRSCVRSHQ